MKKYIVFSCAFLLLFTTMSFAQVTKRQKLAQTGMKFLSISTDARVSALGDAATALEIEASSMFYNPATMAFLPGFANVSLGQVRWIADMNYSHASAAFSPFRGRYGVVGVSALVTDYGDFQGTIRDPGGPGYVDTEMFTPNCYAIGIGYAYAFSTQFSVGGNVKYVNQDLGSSIIGFDQNSEYVEKNYAENVMAFDFGVYYRTGFKSLAFGMCIRNFSEEVKYEAEGFQLPLLFKIGIALDVLDLYAGVNRDMHSLLLTVDAVHPRDYPEQVNLGLEYRFLNMVAFRVGYSTPNDEHNLCAGFGFRPAYKNYNLSLDYAYIPFDIFDSVHKFSVQFSL